VGFDATQAAEEAGSGDELRTPTVVGMAIREGVGENRVGAKPSKDFDDLAEVWPVDLEETVGHLEVFAVGEAQDLGCGGGFLEAQGRRSPRAQFALGEVDDGGHTASSCQLGQGPPSGQLHIIRMRSESAHIYFHSRHIAK
jgi:hypothetical protein